MECKRRAGRKELDKDADRKDGEMRGVGVGNKGGRRQGTDGRNKQRRNRQDKQAGQA